MVNIHNIIEIILKKDISNYTEEQLYFVADKKYYIDKNIVQKVCDIFKKISIYPKITNDKKILVPIDDLAIGMLNFGYYIKLISFLNEFGITPVLLFKNIAINPYFISELDKCKQDYRYIVHVEHISFDNFTKKKNSILLKYNCNKILLTDSFFLKNENDFKNYLFLLHDDFIDLYDTQFFHNNKMKSKITDSTLLFNNMVMDFQPNNITYLATDYFETISRVKWKPIKPHINYGAFYSAKEQQIIKTNLHSEATKNMTQEIFSILGYYENIDDQNIKFRHFTTTNIVTDDINLIENGNMNFVYDIDDKYTSLNIIKLNSENILDSLKEILTVTMDDENYNIEKSIKYNIISDFI